MFGYIDKPDKKLKNVIHRNYYLTQGDSFSLIATPQDGDVELIKNLVFKIGKQREDGRLDEMYSQKYGYTDTSYVLHIESDTTADWEITDVVGEPYIYEIEVQYTDGGVNTIMQAEFTVEGQLRG